MTMARKTIFAALVSLILAVCTSQTSDSWYEWKAISSLRLTEMKSSSEDYAFQTL